MADLGLLRDLLMAGAIQNLAGVTYCERGEQYALQGAVLDVAEDNGVVKGIVSGVETYQVELSAEETGLNWKCSCPRGALLGECCKHVVALALIWTGEVEQDSSHDDIPQEKKIQDYISGQSAKKLGKILFDLSSMDKRLANRLLMEAEAEKIRQGGGTNGLRHLIDRVIKVRDYIDHRKVRAYGAEIEDIFIVLEDLFKAGKTIETINLCERAITAIEYELTHSLTGECYEVGIAVNQLLELHFRACEVAKPDPIVLATRLFALGLNGYLGFFDDALEKYGDLLDEKGFAAYFAALEKARSNLNNGGTGNKSVHSNLAKMEAAFLRSQGLWDRLVDLSVENLQDSNDYLWAIRLCLKSGRRNRAMNLLHRGIEKRVPGWSELSSKLVDLLQKDEKNAEAIDVAWDAFTADPGRYTFFLLKDATATEAEWERCRNKAVKILHKEAHWKIKNSMSRQFIPEDGSWLVHIHLQEGEIEDAWKARCQFGCEAIMELDLALIRGKSHPEDSIPIVREAVLRALKPTGRKAYENAISLLKKLRSMMRSAGKQAEFKRFLSERRHQYKNRRALMEMLKKSRL